MSTGNIYPPGQCTWWCADQEPWCMRFGNLGNAYEWSHNWSARGGYLSSWPAVGSVACFQPNVDYASPQFGHVGVVVAVDPHWPPASFTITEMDGPAGPGHVDPRVCALVHGVLFLYAAAPPAPPKPPPPPPGDDMLVDLAPNEIKVLPGVLSTQTVHLVSQNRTGATGKVVIDTATTSGAPISGEAVDLTGTIPDSKAAPSVDFTAGTRMGAYTTATFTFANQTSDTVTVSLH